MENHEYRTERRILNIMMDDMHADDDDVLKVLRAFDALSILKKRTSGMMRSINKRTFELNKEEYKEKMQWINDYMKLNGMDEDVFTDLDSYETSSDDYDYYYELKTPTEYKEEEEARKAKKTANAHAE